MSSEVCLTPSQKKALHALQEQDGNLFITGSPGTGKSYLIREYLKKSKKKVPVVASTGAAAIIIGGRTFHSFFALGIMQGGVKATLKRALKNNRLRKRIRDLKTLVIDEVSMLSCEALDTAEQIARVVRRSENPWGGIHVIVVGDFAQLPPIGRCDKKEWCFLSDAWQRSQFEMIFLTDVVRTDDEDFLRILDQIRWGTVSKEVADFLNERVVDDAEIEPDVPHIFPRRAQTDAFNKERLAELPHPLQTYETEYGGADRYIEKLMKDAPIPPVLQLKKGALVMLRINDPKQRFVNGTVGTLVELFDDGLIIEINKRTIEIEPFTFSQLDADGKEVAYAINFPLTLAYANTIHKMQGATLDRAHVDLKSLWEPGQAYVALSRARSGKALTLRGWDAFSIKADAAVRRFYDQV